MAIKLICLDADDTLWHNMRHFEATERALQRMLAPFASAADVRARVEATEMRNLKLYGYGAKGFTLSMIETAVEICGDALTPNTISEIVAAGRELLAHPVELFPGIEDTLETLSEHAPLVLITKGDLLHQESKLAASGLGDRFSGIEIVSDKAPDTFARVFENFGVAPDEAIMAGDSMRSDILPALKAGAWAAFVPHHIVWSHEAADAPDHPRFHQIDSLSSLPDLIKRIDS